MSTTTMTSHSQRPVEGPRGRVGFVCELPLPCVAGSPADYTGMTLEQLKNFINFMYESQYKKELPDSNSKTRSGPPPSWWLDFVSFNKSLVPKGISGNGNAKSTEQHRMNLVKLVEACYVSNGTPSMLALAKELAEKHKLLASKKLPKNSGSNVTYGGKSIVFVDAKSMKYDKPSGRKLRDRTLVDVVDSDLGEENAGEIGFNSSVAPSKRPSSADIQRRGRPKTGRQIKTKKGSKRKLVDVQNEKPDKDIPLPAVNCKYCAKEFKIPVFCEDHEGGCEMGPAAAITQLSFLNSLGLLGRSQMAAIPVPSLKPPTLPTDPVTVVPGRPIRKVAKRNQSVNLVKTLPIPLTSVRGQKMVKEVGAVADKTYPPQYERDCRPRGYKPESEKDYQNVMKKAIAKDADNAHVYSYGKIQRVDRYQELVIGLSKESWPALNKLKSARLVLQKIKPMFHTLQLGPNFTKTSYLERQFKGAIQLPRVKVVDIHKQSSPDPVVARFLAREKETARKERQAKEAKLAEKELPAKKAKPAKQELAAKEAKRARWEVPAKEGAKQAKIDLITITSDEDDDDNLSTCSSDSAKSLFKAVDISRLDLTPTIKLDRIRLPL